jgi:chromosome transmission fidelity protein 1
METTQRVLHLQRESPLVFVNFKLIGFQEKLNQVASKSEENQKTEPSQTQTEKQMKCPFMQIKQFLKVLTTPLYEGRIVLNIDTTTKSSLKYMLLNPNKCFEQIVADAHAVVLVGGTMKPISDFEQLIADRNRIEYYSCDHVIPKDNIMAIAMASSSNNVKFDFSFTSRDNAKMVSFPTRKCLKEDMKRESGKY